MTYTEISEQLREEYSMTLKAISEAKAGSEEAKWQLQKLSELNKQIVNLEHSEMESRNHRHSMMMKEEELKESKKTRIGGWILGGTTAVGSFVGSWVWMRRSMRFEETGSFSSRAPQFVSGITRLFRK